MMGVASDGHEAVALATELRPHIVLMDLRMSRCDGVEATRLLREQQPETKVVVLTTEADDRVRDRPAAGRRLRIPHQGRGRDGNPRGPPARP